MTRTLHSPLILILGASALYFGLGLAKPVRAELYLATALPVALIAIAGVAVALMAYYSWTQHHRSVQERRLLLLDQIVAIALAALVVVMVPARSLIEADESAMVLAAMAAKHTSGAVVPGAGIVDAFGVLHATAAHIEKRGTGYPALVMIVSYFTGSTLRAAYVINIAALAALLFFTARIARRFLDSRSAFIAVLLVCAFPLATVIARTGTYDTLNAMLLLILLHSTLSYWQKPHLLRIPLLAATAMLVAQMRYESALMAAIAIGLVQLRGLRYTTDRAQQVCAILLPLLLVPVVWRFAIPLDAELPNPQAQVWSLQNFAENAYALMHWTLNWRNWDVGNPVVGLLAVLRLPFVFRWQSKSTGEGVSGKWIILGFALPLLVTLLFSFWGDIEYTITSRYFIFYVVVLAMLATSFIQRVCEHWRTTPAWPFIMAAAFICGLGLFNARRGDGFYNPLPDYRDAVLAGIQQAYGRCNILLTTVFPGVFVSHDIGAIHFQSWQQNAHALPALLEQMGIVAVVAPLATVQGGGYYGEYYRDQVKDAKKAAEVLGIRVTASLHELWRSNVPLVNCSPRQVITGLDATDLKSAASGLLQRAPPIVNLL